jgi:hypothetical protein
MKRAAALLCLMGPLTGTVAVTVAVSVSVAVTVVFSGCGNSGASRRPANGEATAGVPPAIEKAYLIARREERTCEQLRKTAEDGFTQHNHAAALEASELTLAFCPANKLAAVEQTMVMLARTEARSGGSPGRSVRMRLQLPLPAGYHLLWWGAYADRKLGLSNLPVGPHRVDVEMHVWRSGPGGEGQMLRVAGGIDVNIDARMPVVLDATLSAQGSSLMPLTINLRPGSTNLPPGISGATGAEASRNFDLTARDETPSPRPPAPLAQMGLPSVIDLELCFDARGQVTRVEPLAWPHPHHLGVFVNGLRAWRMRPYVVNGLPMGFCTGWKQTVELPARQPQP